MPFSFCVYDAPAINPFARQGFEDGDQLIAAEVHLIELLDQTLGAFVQAQRCPGAALRIFNNDPAAGHDQERPYLVNGGGWLTSGSSMIRIVRP